MIVRRYNIEYGVCVLPQLRRVSDSRICYGTKRGRWPYIHTRCNRNDRETPLVSPAAPGKYLSNHAVCLSPLAFLGTMGGGAKVAVNVSLLATSIVTWPILVKLSLCLFLSTFPLHLLSSPFISSPFPIVLLIFISSFITSHTTINPRNLTTAQAERILGTSQDHSSVESTSEILLSA